jgi:hypothetical protein
MTDNLSQRIFVESLIAGYECLFFHFEFLGTRKLLWIYSLMNQQLNIEGV